MSRSGNVHEKLRIIESEISKIPGAKHKMGEKWMVCCPYHNDSSPSATVSTDTAERAVPIGWFGCFSCKKSVKWNDLAATLHLQKFGKNENLSSDDYGNPEDHRESFLGSALGSDDDDEQDEDVDTKRFPDLKDLEFLDDWPFKKWRDVKVKLLTKIGAKLVRHKEYGRHWVWLPVKVDDVLRGYVRATLDKAQNGKSSYLNAKGGWSRKWGLIYYDYSVRLMKKKGLHTMVLCEGPRDSLRFLARGIPAMSVLGALNWGSDKRHLLEEAGVEKVILAFDGDKAGWTACRHVYSDCKKFFNTKYVSMWTTSPAWDSKRKKFPTDKRIKALKLEYKEQGKKWIELDPFSCDDSWIDLIEENLE